MPPRQANLQFGVLDRWNWAIESGRAKALSVLERLVLHLLANRASNGLAWPSIAWIMRYAGCSRWGAKLAVQQLVRHRLIVRLAAGGGRGRTHRYALMLSDAHALDMRRPAPWRPPANDWPDGLTDSERVSLLAHFHEWARTMRSPTSPNLTKAWRTYTANSANLDMCRNRKIGHLSRDPWPVCQQCRRRLSNGICHFCAETRQQQRMVL